MNRQERRRLRKFAETEQRNLQYLADRADKREETRLALYAIAIGLAHHNLYGKGRDEYIEPFIKEWNKQIRRIVEEGLTLEELQKELYDKADISFVVV